MYRPGNEKSRMDIGISRALFANTVEKRRILGGVGTKNLEIATKRQYTVGISIL